jgi:hypothetical protein
MVNDVPTGPDVGLTLLMFGGGTGTVKLSPLLAWPETVTTTLPVIAPVGTGTTMLVVLQLVGVPTTPPPNVTALEFCTGPKFVPEIITAVPTGPDPGFSMTIAGVTVKFTLLLVKPPTVTTTPTIPAVPMFGTGTTMLPALQLLG